MISQHSGLGVTVKVSAGKSSVTFICPYLLWLGHQLLEHLHSQHLLQQEVGGGMCDVISFLRWDFNALLQVQETEIEEGLSFPWPLWVLFLESPSQPQFLD